MGWWRGRAGGHGVWEGGGLGLRRGWDGEQGGMEGYVG